MIRIVVEKGLKQVCISSIEALLLTDSRDCQLRRPKVQQMGSGSSTPAMGGRAKRTAEEISRSMQSQPELEEDARLNEGQIERVR